MKRKAAIEVLKRLLLLMVVAMVLMGFAVSRVIVEALLLVWCMKRQQIERPIYI